MRASFAITALFFVLPAATMAKPPDLPANEEITFVAARPLPAAAAERPHETPATRIEALEEEEIVERASAPPVLRRRLPAGPEPKPVWQELLRILDMLRTTEPLGTVPDDSSF
jgi:hypothetical protein